MILKYTRIFSLLFIVVSLSIGAPLMAELAHNAIKPQYNWIAWTFVIIAAVVLLVGIRLFVAPPTVLKITSDGIQIYYKAGRSFSKDFDLLPWRLIEKMQMIRLHGRDFSFSWAIELTLTAPVPFDATKRDALQNTILSTVDPNRFYLDTFVLNLPRGDVLDVLQSALQRWQEKARGTQGRP